jgi:hypothetical protein
MTSGKRYVDDRNTPKKNVSRVGLQIHICILADLNKVKEVFIFCQDDLATEETLVLDCNSEIYVWVGLHSDVTSKEQALNIGKVSSGSEFDLFCIQAQYPACEISVFCLFLHFCRCSFRMAFFTTEDRLRQQCILSRKGMSQHFLPTSSSGTVQSNHLW